MCPPLPMRNNFRLRHNSYRPRYPQRLNKVGFCIVPTHTPTCTLTILVCRGGSRAAVSSQTPDADWWRWRWRGGVGSSCLPYVGGNGQQQSHQFGTPGKRILVTVGDHFQVEIPEFPHLNFCCDVVITTHDIDRHHVQHLSSKAA